MKNTSYLSIALLLFFCSSCTKEGPGGKIIIKGRVMHHEQPIPNATVYIKYGTQDSPGSNITYYDANVKADANANYQFNNLRRGEYYLFGVGFDSTIVEQVSGGIPVKVKNKEETVTLDVPVVE
ncbi:MAG TPA: hypothetical protein VFL70_10055 [Bacteroidia bacterium]|nr:hypothetical protein [Bacteroidia bacterium]